MPPLSVILRGRGPLFNYDEFLDEIKRIYENGKTPHGPCIAKCIEKIINSGYINNVEYEPYLGYRTKINNVLKILAGKKLLTQENIDEFMKTFTGRKCYDWMLSISSTDENDLNLFLYGKIDLFEKMSDDIKMTQEQFNKIFTSPIFGEYVSIFDKYTDKFNKIIKSNNIEISKKCLGTASPNVIRVSFLIKHGLNVKDDDIIEFLKKEKDSVFVNYIFEDVMPRFNLTLDTNMTLSILSLGIQLPEYVLNELSKKDIDLRQKMFYILNSLYAKVGIANPCTDIIEFCYLLNRVPHLAEHSIQDKISNCNLSRIFKYSYCHLRKEYITKLLNNKYLPDNDAFAFMVRSNHWWSHGERQNRIIFFKEIMELLYQCGYVIDESMYYTITFDIDILEKIGYTFPNEIKKKLEVYNDTTVELSPSYPPALTKDIPYYIDTLVLKLYPDIRTDNVEKLRQYFSQSLYVTNPLIFEYLKDYHNYIPTFAEINKIKSYKNRFLMIAKYYPNYIET
jgi:hypothetical protein